MDVILKKNIDRCRMCPFREPGCRSECYTGLEIDRRQKELNERIKAEKDKEREYYSRSRDRDMQFIRKEINRK